MFRYLILRMYLVNNLTFSRKKLKEDILKESIIDFIIKELKLSQLSYKEVKIYKFSGFDNSLGNIVDELLNKVSLEIIKDENDKEYDFNEYIEMYIKNILFLAKREAICFKSDKYYEYHLKFNALNILNELFNVSLIENTRFIEGFYQDLDQNLNYEEIYSRYTHVSTFQTDNIKCITENDLENYVFTHLEEIEAGLRPISRQYDIGDGRIDILAKDKNNKFVIIELKIANDKHLIWQVLYYPDKFKELNHIENNIRVLTVCPNYPEYILKPLKNLRNIETIKYKVNILNSKIDKIIFDKVV